MQKVGVPTSLMVLFLLFCQPARLSFRSFLKMLATIVFSMHHLCAHTELSIYVHMCTCVHVEMCIHLVRAFAIVLLQQKPMICMYS